MDRTGRSSYGRCADTHGLADITATIAGGEATTEEGIQLVSRAAELGKRHSNLANETEALHAERIGHVAALEDYRETLAYGF